MTEWRKSRRSWPTCPAATAALGAVAQRLDLDYCYCGADFSLLPDGRHASKNPFIDRILLAFEAMVMARAGLPPRVPAHSPPDTRSWT